MKKKWISAALAAVLAVSLAGCAGNAAAASSGTSQAAQSSASAAKEKITFVLDWTPNTNHTGLYVAQSKGYFAAQGLDVELVQPPEDGATALVGSGKAQLGIDFQDSLAPAFQSKTAVPVTAVAAVLQHNTSGIISRKSKGITSPKKLEGKTYATWDLPVEKAIIKSVMTKDGGDFSKLKMAPTTVTDVVAALKTNIDAVWIFYAWDGIACKVKGLETNYFQFKDIDPVFDYYTPVIIANNSFLKNKPETAKKFLAAAKQGYEYAIAHPQEAADILCKASPELDKQIVLESQKWIGGQYKAEASRWGYIDPKRWNAFYQWLDDNKLVTESIPAGTGFSDDYLPQ
ncbi:MAG: ABC transporter substrate-binding protein [Clostridiales bacterium]|nr:ABC transporter substrate-binding protein [Clostridiales bacterium]